MPFQMILQQLSLGMLKSLGIFILTLVFSLPLGLVVCAGRMSKNVILKNVTKFYISVMRGTPLMLQLLVWYYGPYYMFGMNIGNYRYTALILGFVFNYAAYLAEIYRSGLESIPVGQYEAARLLSYSKTQTYVKIVLPQMIKRVLPAVTNEIITLVKDTSLAFVLTYAEMFTLAKQIAASNTTMMPFAVAGLFYYVFNFLVAFVMERIEKKLSYYR